MNDKNLRCPWAIKYGMALATRCTKDAGHEEDVNDSTHAGRGLVQYPEQTIRWLHGDTRQFTTDNEAEYSYHVDWEEP